MSTSLLYHTFDIRGYRYVNTKYQGGAVIFNIRQEPGELRCPVCGAPKVIRRGQVQRHLRNETIGKTPVWIALAVQRVFCRLCGALGRVKVKFAQERRSYTKAFARYALELSRT